MINAAAFKNRLIYLYIILIAFIPSPYLISFSGVNLNLDRLFFIVMAGCWLLFFIMLKRYQLNKIQIFLVLYFLIILFNNIFIGHLQLMSIYISALLILITSSDLRTESLVKAINIAFYAYVFWMFYSLAHFYISGPLIEAPFSSYLPGFFETKLEHAEIISASYSLFPRISFPYATPPQLAAVGALYCFFYLFLNDLYNYHNKDIFGISKANINFGLFFSIVIILATVSKTGIAILAAGLLVNFVFKISGLFSIKRLFKFILSIIVIFVSVSVLILVASQIPELDFIFTRLFYSETDFDPTNSDGHLSIRIAGLWHFLELNWVNKLWGIGYLNFSGLHYHSSFLTALIETGLIGSLSLVGIVLYPAMKAIFFFLNRSLEISTINARYMIVTSASLFTAHIVYEMPYINSLWFFWALVILLSREIQQE
jgi:hypothetical protein